MTELCLKHAALQLRSINTWEYLSPEGFALNSKWNEAERYICNPLSGEVPLECLSSKTLMNGRSFRNITNRMTMSAPLIHHSSRIHLQKLTDVHPIQGFKTRPLVLVFVCFNMCLFMLLE